MVAIVRRRFLVYLQIGFLSLAGLYLLLRFDQIPTPNLPESLNFGSNPGTRRYLSFSLILVSVIDPAVQLMNHMSQSSLCIQAILRRAPTGHTLVPYPPC